MPRPIATVHITPDFEKAYFRYPSTFKVPDDLNGAQRLNGLNDRNLQLKFRLRGHVDHEKF